MVTYLFAGTITTQQSLAYSPPGHRGPDKRSLLQHMTVPSPAGALETMYVSGSTIRGELRHACADVWLGREGTELCPPRRYGVLVRRQGRESAAGSASMQPATNRPCREVLWG